MLDKPVLLLTLVLFLALGTERLLELFRALSDHLEARRGSFKKWHDLANRLRHSIEVRLQYARAESPSAFQMALFVVCRHLIPAPAGSGGTLVVDVAQVRKAAIRFRYKLIGVAVGVAFAFLFQLDIFDLVQQEMSRGRVRTAEVESAFWLWMATLVTGIAMGLGAGPVHTMINALERARQTRV